MSLDPNHRALLRKNLSSSSTQQPERKKRRRHVSPPKDNEDIKELFEAENSSDSMEFEDVDIEAPETPPPTNPITANDGSDSEEGSDDFEDLEDVDIDAMLDEPSKPEESITITINEQKNEEAKGKKKKVVTVPKQERHRRKLVHQLYLMAMLAHGATRNSWCNDKTLQKLLVENFPRASKATLIHPLRLLIL
ncbi:uncharacterized protein CXQ87_003295 [Candidozyma duobushaemuli]|uniref:Uncharacterized protein n=1 Tax=Candidozyma duobushaemuli TaxID=1231522 RepID=A0A2V1ACN5_9ASCO|nr:uncharacterized protein CXQ87_003295 [[Candida] duobushaemulonis]PVH15455.1 hypothetical protein CXQ87_003295 [[Candida] duobushaemulonis]